MDNTQPTPEQLTNRLAWVRALLSDKFKQGKQRLNDGQGHFCCLGVACDVLKIHSVHNFGGVGYGKQEMEAFLPQEAVDLLSTDPKVEYDGCWLSLSELNDDEYSASFAVVAEFLINKEIE